MATCKAVMRLTLEYASSIWSPMASPTSINKLQVMQNAALTLRGCTGITHDTNIQYLHDETNILPIQKHLQLHTSQVRQKTQYPSHPLHRYTIHNTSQRLKKSTTFNKLPIYHKHPHRPLHCHYSRHKSKHARHTYKHCLSAPLCRRQ